VTGSLFADARREAFDHSECGNGPDEYGNWPCEPQVIFGSNDAECQTCGRVAAWKAPAYGVKITRGTVTRWKDEPISSRAMAAHCAGVIEEWTGERGEIVEVTVSVAARGRRG
jgi:hypothetical protein